MKNQYFGDENDYKKYGVIRALSESLAERILVCWMLTRDDSPGQGQSLSYQEKPDTFRKFDPELFDHLKNVVVGRGERDVRHAAKAVNSANVSYFLWTLEDNEIIRNIFFRQLERSSKSAGMVFFDPDTGIGPSSVRKGNRSSSRYLFYDEIGRFYNDLGKSILIYQHWTRVEKGKLRHEVVEKIGMWTGTREVYTLDTNRMVYFLLPQNRHSKLIKQAVDRIESKWDPLIKVKKYEAGRLV